MIRARLSLSAGRSRPGLVWKRRPVPSKRTLIQEFGVAGGTIDKAIAILRNDGLVRIVTGRGIYVVPDAERPA